MMQSAVQVPAIAQIPVGRPLPQSEPPPPRRKHPGAPEVVKSAVRVLEVLEFFDRVQAPSSVGNIAGALRIPQSSTSALLRSLVKIGYLRFDPRARTYLPTERVPLLGSWVARPLFQGGPLLRLMERLAQTLNCAVVLGRRNGDHAQCAHLVDPAQSGIGPSYVAELGIGTVQPLAQGAMGLALLGTMADDEVRGLMHRLNASAGRDTLVRIPELLARLAEMRAREHVCIIQDGIATLAVPVPQEPGRMPLVLALVGPESVLADSQAALKAVREEMARWLRPAKARLAVFDVPPSLAAHPGRAVAQAHAA